METFGNDLGAKTSKKGQIYEYMCEKCDKLFQTNAGLWKHKSKDNCIKNVKLQHARANIMIVGTDINKIFTDPSFKNHDISIVTINDTVYHIDPSLSEIGMSLIFQQ